MFSAITTILITQSADVASWRNLNATIRRLGIRSLSNQEQLDSESY